MADPPSDQDELSHTDAARLMAITPERVRQLCNTGKLRHRKRPQGPKRNDYFIPVDAIAEWIRDRPLKAAPANPNPADATMAELEKALAESRISSLETELGVALAQIETLKEKLAGERTTNRRLRAMLRIAIEVDDDGASDDS